jgi:hypothetical protein
MMNYLPFESPESTVSTCVIVPSADTNFYFFPNSRVFLMSNDTWIGLTLKHNMKIPSPPGLRRCELREELFVLGTKGVLLGWLSRVFHFPNPSLLIGQSLGKESAQQDRIRFSWRRLPPTLHESVRAPVPTCRNSLT